MQVFFVVLARDRWNVKAKSKELTSLGYPFVVICGENVGGENVVYREPRGKYDAINFGLNLVPPGVDVVAFNDVDTEIHNLEAALKALRPDDIHLVFVKVNVGKGPQLTFYSFLDALRRRVPVSASGELMLIKRKSLRDVAPLRECKAEDSYILFRVLENRGKVFFCEDCYVTTTRTANAGQEESYKRRTVGGIYQALSMSKPPLTVKLFYTLLPFVSPLLLILGKKGYYWTKGILLGYIDYLRGDRTGAWRPNYSRQLTI